MLASLIECALALAVLLLVASLPVGTAGRPLRRVALGLFLGVVALAVVVHLLRTLLPIVLTDWRFYVGWVVASPIAYRILVGRTSAARRDAAHEQRSNPPKRRDRGVPTEVPGERDEVTS